MALVICCGKFLLNQVYGNWLDLGIYIKLWWYVILCGIGLVSFVFGAKVLGVLNIKDLTDMLLHRRKTHAE